MVVGRGLEVGRDEGEVGVLQRRTADHEFWQFEDVGGPPSYRLASNADVTVLLSVNQKVVANFAFRDGELSDGRIEEVLKAVPGIIKK